MVGVIHIESTALFLVCIDFHNFAVAGIEAVRQAEHAPLHRSGKACSALLILLELGNGQHHRAAVTLGSGACCVVEHVAPFNTCTLAICCSFGNDFKTSNFDMWGGQAVKDWPR